MPTEEQIRDEKCPDCKGRLWHLVWLSCRPEPFYPMWGWRKCNCVELAHGQELLRKEREHKRIQDERLRKEGPIKIKIFMDDGHRRSCPTKRKRRPIVE